MSIHIITHCYSVRLNHYAEFLCYQLSSLVLHPPKVKTTITVCCSPTDNNTFRVFTSFAHKFDIAGVGLTCHGMLDHCLFRRCIGRDEVAKTTRADLVWFTDCDHVFGEGCLDEAYQQWQQLKKKTNQPLMIYPNRINIHESHAIGDLLAAENHKLNRQNILRKIDPVDFVEKRYNRAIGGVQLVDGDYCREFGYLHKNKKWQQPRFDGRPFGDFKDDVAFRTEFSQRNGMTQGVKIKNLYRLRHSLTTYQ